MSFKRKCLKHELQNLCAYFVLCLGLTGRGKTDGHWRTFPTGPFTSPESQNEETIELFVVQKTFCDGF